MAERIVISVARILAGILAVVLPVNAFGAPFALNLSEGDLIYDDVNQLNCTIYTGTASKLRVVKRQFFRSDQETEMKIRRARSGFTLTETVLRLEEAMDGKVLYQRTYGSLLVGSPISSFISRSGELTNIIGPEKVVSDAKLNVPSNALKKVETVIGPVPMLVAAQRNWSLGPELLLGRDSDVGAAWSDEKKVILEPGKSPVTVYIQSRVVDSRIVEGDQVATVLSFISTDKDTLKRLSSEQIRSLGDKRVTEFLEVSSETLPVQKWAKRQVLKVKTMDLIEAERIRVDVKRMKAGQPPDGQITARTVKVRETSKLRRMP